MKNSGLSSGLFLVAEWIMKFSVTNLLWLFCNIPAIFIVFNIMYTDHIPNVILLVAILFICMPLTLFPATMALFATVREWIIVEKDSGQLIKAYFRYYKENYRRGVTGGVILTVIWGVFTADVYYFYNLNTVFLYLLCVLGIILFVFTIHFISVSVHYNISLNRAIKNAFMLTLGSPVLFLATTISSGIVTYISVNLFHYLFVFFTFSFIAYLSFAAFYRQYLAIIQKQKH